MSDTLPKLEISFQPASYDDFVIEELTNALYISKGRRKRGAGFVDLWTEFVIRRKGKQDGLLQVPDIVLNLTDDLGGLDSPTTRLPDFSRSQQDIHDDMNFVMHSDIWYSFILQGESNREFMTKGYNQPIRVLYHCYHCAGSEQAVDVNHESWIQGKNHIFSVASPWKAEAGKLLKAIKDFNEEIVHSRADHAYWEDLTVKVGKTDHKVSKLKNHESYAPVYFERGKELPARFAVRRFPWKIPEKEIKPEMYQISYGATARISRQGSVYTLRPVLFAPDSPNEIDARIGANEAIRFWVRWQSKAALDFDIAKDRFSFAQVLYVHPPLERYNSFFRVPEGFDFVPGSVTELKHYPVPPRLFFLWEREKVKPDQCFSDHRSFDGNTSLQIELFAEFSDKNRETNRLVNLFILGVVLNTLTALAIQGWVNASDHNTFIGKLHLAQSSLLAIAVGLFAAAREYRRHAFKWRGVTLLTIGCFAIFHLLEKSQVAVGVISVLCIPLFIWTFGLRYNLKYLLSEITSLWPIKKTLAKRRYLREIEYREGTRNA